MKKYYKIYGSGRLDISLLVLEDADSSRYMSFMLIMFRL